MLGIKNHTILITIGLVCCFLIFNTNFIGLNVLHIKKIYHQNSQFKSLHSITAHEKIQVLKFTISEIHKTIQWKKQTEFRFKNKMYDVIYSESTCDLFIVWCVQDEKEDHINHFIDYWVSISWDSNETLPISNIYSFSKFTFDGILLTIKIQLDKSFIDYKNFHFLYPIYQITKNISVPPPKFSC